MKIKVKKFQVKKPKKIKLNKWPTEIESYYSDNKEYQKLLSKNVDQMSELQSLLYASNRFSLLIIIQGMDACGKDSAIKHVLSGINPQGCEVHSFKKPSIEELKHDFLWRTTCRLPERGRIGIFNRSYYEEVLIVRIHHELLKSEKLPTNELIHKNLWKNRYRSIVNFEQHLHHNGTIIIKIFLHLSKNEQRKRFLSRLDEPNKNWKIEMSDINERKLWKQYQEAYEKCISNTSTKDAPWYIVPADDKNNARLIISQIIVSTLKNLKMHYPVLHKSHNKELETIRKHLDK